MRHAAYKNLHNKESKNIISKETTQTEEERIRKLIGHLPDEQRRALYIEIEKQIKDPDTYATLATCFIVGIHHFYLKKWQHGLINIAIFSTGFTLLIIDLLGIYTPSTDQSPFFSFLISWQLGLVLILGLSLSELYELFSSQSTVEDYNNKIMEAIYNEKKILS